ncbi:MAG: hypothetical protein H0W94_01245 [Actinobacteria bacterium]|nr:hypothetical protein [Actinomycetota bacterium]
MGRPNGPAHSFGLRITYNGSRDAFVAKISSGEEPGPVCTITGTAGPDAIEGAGGDDVICARGGSDTVSG